MEKPIIVIKVKAKQFSALKNLAQHVYDNMNVNPNFPLPQPPMPILLAAILVLNGAISKWGQKGNRGSHNDYLDLIKKSAALLSLITEEAAYCMSIVDITKTFEEQTTFLASSGFTIKNPKNPQGILQMVQNFRRFISAQVNFDQIKLKWKKPEGVTINSNVKFYKVFRNTANNFDTAFPIATPTATTYTDTPGTGTFYYWVVACNNKGDGVRSTVIVASFGPPPA